MVHVLIYSLIHQFSFYATFVYGLPTIVARRTLWEDLRQWCPNAPWLIMEILTPFSLKRTSTMVQLSPLMKLQISGLAIQILV